MDILLCTGGNVWRCGHAETLQGKKREREREDFPRCENEAQILGWTGFQLRGGGSIEPPG